MFGGAEAGDAGEVAGGGEVEIVALLVGLELVEDAD